MTRAQAHRVLDAVREGQRLSRRFVTLALIATGDLPENAASEGCKPVAQYPIDGLDEDSMER